jgi:hypothetical protein
VDIINVVSVVGAITVNQRLDFTDNEIGGGFYWRQGYDCNTKQLSVCFVVPYLVFATANMPSDARINLQMPNFRQP